jgi:hypothetical protein
MFTIINVRLTEYCPFQPNMTEAEAKMQGGVYDRLGKPLYSLEDYLEGKAPYVSLACDHTAGPPGNAAQFRKYGMKVWIPEISENIGAYVEGVTNPPRMILFRLVDTGGHFFGEKKKVRVAGYEPIDVCRRRRPAGSQSFSGKLTTLWLSTVIDLVTPGLAKAK